MRRARPISTCAPENAPPRPPVIGLLGAPGSGKSTLAARLAGLGAAVIDADALAHAALNQPEVLDQLVAWWGPSVRAAGEPPSADRAAIAARVFGDPAALERLEQLVHPRVNAERARLRAVYGRRAGVKAIVEDCPLLLEKGLEDACDALVWVETPRAERLRRVAAARGWSEAELDRREAQQLPLDIKRRRADYVVTGDAVSDGLREAERLLGWVAGHPKTP